MSPLIAAITACLIFWAFVYAFGWAVIVGAVWLAGVLAWYEWFVFGDVK